MLELEISSFSFCNTSVYFDLIIVQYSGKDCFLILLFYSSFSCHALG